MKFQVGGHFSRWPPPQWIDINVYLLIQAWKLAWAVSVGHLTIAHPQLPEMSRWRPFSKMATTLVEQIKWYKVVGSYVTLPWPRRAKVRFSVDLSSMKVNKQIEPPCLSQKCGENPWEPQIQNGYHQLWRKLTFQCFGLQWWVELVFRGLIELRNPYLM